MTLDLFNRFAAAAGGLLLCGLIAPPAAGQAVNEPSPRPNILILFSDDQGYHDVGCFGGNIETPRLDALAARGMRLAQFYAASSICTPSRYGLLTGRFAHRSVDQLTGALMFLGEEDHHRGIRDGETTFVQELREAGYRTHLVGKWHLGHGEKSFWPTRHGFETFVGHTGGCIDYVNKRYGEVPDWYRGEQLGDSPGYVTEAIADEAIALIDNPDERPWMMHVAFNAPHYAKMWDPSKGTTVNMMQPRAVDMPPPGKFADPVREAFAAKVRGMDAAIGRIVDAVDQSPAVSRRTLIIFMTDHGGDPVYGGNNEPFRGVKATLYEGGLRVPCIVRYPAMVPAGSVNDSVASALDWYPTLRLLTGIPPVVDALPLDGQDLTNVLKGQSVSTHRPIVWQTGPSPNLKRSRWLAVRDGDYKLVESPGRESEELFNVATDPAESKDLIDELPDVAVRLRAIAEASGAYDKSSLQ